MTIDLLASAKKNDDRPTSDAQHLSSSTIAMLYALCSMLFYTKHNMSCKGGSMLFLIHYPLFIVVYIVLPTPLQYRLFPLVSDSGDESVAESVAPSGFP